MSGGKPVFVSVMYMPKAGIRWGSVHRVESCPREVTSFSGMSRAYGRAGQLSIACWNDSGAVPQPGQVKSGFSLNQEGWTAR